MRQPTHIRMTIDTEGTALLARVFAEQAHVSGMNAENQVRIVADQCPAYGIEHFDEASAALADLACRLEELGRHRAIEAAGA